MIREKLRLKVYQLDEITLQRKQEYDYDESDRNDIENEIELALDGKHIIGYEGQVYVVSIVSMDNDD